LLLQQLVHDLTYGGLLSVFKLHVFKLLL
jgi:hypothetical protein